MASAAIDNRPFGSKEDIELGMGPQRGLELGPL